MRVAIVGSRDFPHMDWVLREVSFLPQGSCVISGGARGVDRAAVLQAQEIGLETLVFPADWDKYGKRAGFLRNQQIVMAADRIVAFWDGESKGTAHTISMAMRANKPVVIIQAPKYHPSAVLPDFTTGQDN